MTKNPSPQLTAPTVGPVLNPSPRLLEQVARYKELAAKLGDARPGPKADAIHARIERLAQQVEKDGNMADFLALAHA